MRRDIVTHRSHGTRVVFLAAWLAFSIHNTGLSTQHSALAFEDLGNLSANRFDSESSSNPFGKGSPFAPNGINNPFSPYGSPFSNTSATNRFATEAPRLYDQQGNYRGKLSANPYDPDSTANQVGRYGSPYSPDSLNNQFGAGSPFRPDSPNNPYGSGWRIEGK